jgi:hypothetical protein
VGEVFTAYRASFGLVEPLRRQVAALIGEATCNPVVKFLIQLLFSEACTG